MSALAARLVAVPAVIPHHHCSFGADEEAAALRVLRSGRLAPGPEAARLEKLLARLSEGADAVTLTSGSAALSLVLRGLGIRPGDRVALPSYARPGLLHAVRAAGATPLICDIDPHTLTISADDLERRAGRHLRVLVVGHPGGRPTPLQQFLGRGWSVVEDCGDAFGATLGGRPVGSWGDAAVFCFAPARQLTCGGPGGAVTSRRASLVRTIRELASCESRVLDAQRLEALMGDLHASIATVQVERLPELIARRASIAARYNEAFAGFGVAMSPGETGCRAVYSRYLIRIPDADRIIDALRRQGILVQRPVERPLHDLLGLRSRFPITEAACAGIVSLPIYPSLRNREVERIVDATARLLS